MFTFLKWAFLALSVGSVVYAGFLMLMAKPSIKQVIDAAALQAGTKVTKPDMTEYDGDQLVWRLQADTAQDLGEKVNLEQPRLKVLMDNGEMMPIRASKGVYIKDKQQVHLKGDVQVEYQTWQLSSQAMDYFQVKEELQIPRDFVLHQDGIKVTGKDMRIYQKSGVLKVLQGVHMDIEETQ